MSTNTINSVDEVINIFDKEEKDIKPCQESTEDIKQEDNPTEEEVIANAFTGDKIKGWLAAKGPTVKAILLKPNGSIEQILYESTPSKNHVTEILGGPPTIIGQYVDLDVIVVGQRYNVSPSEHPLNTHPLRYPFNKSVIHGNIFLYRFNQDCVMEDFTIEEYNEFISKSNEDIGKVFEPKSIPDEEYNEEEEDIDDIDGDEQYQFMRSVILNKLREEFPKKFGREPTDEELESYMEATMAMATGGGMAGFGGGMDSIEEEEDESDEEYDPNDDDDMKQMINDEEEDIVNDEELAMDKQDIECVQNENKLPLIDMNNEDEEKLVNSAEFEKELHDAIENVKHIATIDKEKILSMARDAYMADTGEEPSDEIIADAFKMFGNNDDDIDDDEIIEQKCIDDAIEHVKNLGKMHRKEFIEKISNTFEELNGVKPNENEMNKILGNIQNAFLDEAMDEFMDENGGGGGDDDADDADEDYNPNEDIQQIEDDKKLEVFEELEHGDSDDADEDYDPNEEIERKQMENDAKIDMESDDENDDENDDETETQVKVLVTPVKRKESGSKMGVFFEECDEKKTLQFAQAKFEKINGRKPTNDDNERLKEFCKTGMLFESQINVSNNNNNNDLNNDSNDDEDYMPENDNEDYSKDIQDEIEYENEFEMEKSMNNNNDNQNENDDISNQIQI